MPGLYNWYLERIQGVSTAWGVVCEHPKLLDGTFIHTSLIQEAAVEGDGLVLITYSGNRYLLRPGEILPNPGEDTASCLAEFGIGAGFVENCLRARREADARLREEDERLTEPGELLLTVVGTGVVRNLFRDAEGAAVSIKPTLHESMFEDSILITDWNGGKVDFRYFPRLGRIEPYHISDGLRTIKVRNLGTRAMYFGKAGREVSCPPGEITAIPAAEHDDEWLFSPDVVNGKCLISKRKKEADDA